MPKQLTDQEIRAVIETLRSNEPTVTGAAVRKELRQLYGAPGGVDRIYRLLKASQPSRSALSSELQLLEQIADLKQQLDAACRRVELAEHREQAHQEKWAMEIDQLRQQLRAAQIDSRKLSEAQHQVLELRREIHRLTTR